MPTYQYRCTDCGRDLEVVQKFSDASLTECPTCAGQLRKVFNAVGVVFKGSGFYRTDSRAAAADSNGSDKKSDAGETAGSGDRKPVETKASTNGSGTNGSSSNGSGSNGSGYNGSGSNGSGSKSSKPDKTASTSGASSTGNKAASS